MKLQVLAAAVAALALAGAASAQNGSPSSAIGGVNNQSPPANAIDAGSARLAYSKASTQEAYREKVGAWKMACAADRDTLCQGRTAANAVYECVRIHRSKLSPLCRAATYAVERAAADGAYAN